jgi:hypothetical protein
MQRGTVWIAGVCGLVGLVAGRASAPARPVFVQTAAAAAPVVVVAPAPPPAAPEAPVEDEGDLDDGTDLAAVLANLHDEAAAHPDRRAIVGEITDGENNEPAIGATVVATSPSLVGEWVVITDDRGAFEIFDLPVGYYRLTIYFNDATSERSDVMSREAGATHVVVRLDHSPPPPPPPPPSAADDDDDVVNVPTGRTFSAVLGAAADSQDDEGITFSGGDIIENSYVVD